MNLRSVHTIQTADRVPLSVELAGIGNRIYAALIDLLATLLILALMYYVIATSALLNRELSKNLGYLLPFLLLFGYHFFQEWLWRGKTIGKHILKLRSVRQNGQPMGFWEAFGRNLMRLIDVYGAGIGVIPILFSPSEKRFGDFLAGTLVINDQPLRYPGTTSSYPLQNTKNKPSIFEPNPPALDLQGVRLTAQECDLLENYMARRSTLLTSAQETLQRDLTDYFRERLFLGDALEEKLLESLADACR